ncbi:MAG: penicillin acylase family protein [Actinomycetota bacterium]
MSSALSSAGPVTVTLDRWGIGHAVAPDTAGAFAAQGWLAATDRFWQMEWDRRKALGRCAEIAGRPALAEDVLFRRLDLAKRARDDWATLTPETRAMTEAYAHGVNTWLAANVDSLPTEFDVYDEAPAPWEPWHCVAVYQIRHFFMGTFLRKLWRGTVALRAQPALLRAMVGEVGDHSAMVPATPGTASVDLLVDAETAVAAATEHLRSLPETEGASNSWAVHGSRTASGAPLLAGDPHRGVEFPNVYHQCHVAGPDFDVIGLAFPGVPGFPHFGHNADVAWCITHGMADDTDVFVESGPTTVTRTETVAVRHGDPVEVTIAETERGPVAFGDPSSGEPCLSVQWTPWHGGDRTLDGARAMLTATDVDSLEAAMRPWVVPVNNVLSADRAGSISFRLRGRVVERPPASRWAPVPGDDEHTWRPERTVPYDDLHRWRNPERGFLVTANNRIGDDTPYVSLDFAGPARHDRIVELLDALDPAEADVEAMAAIHLDVQSLVAPRLQARLAPATPATEAGAAVQAIVEAWDGRVDGDSIAATVCAGVRRWWAEEVAGVLGLHDAHLGAPGWPTPAFAARALNEASGRLLLGDGWAHLPGYGSGDPAAGSEHLAARLGVALDEVAARLAADHGPEPEGWRWGSVHTMLSPHPLALLRPELEGLHPPVDGVPGDGDTVRCAAYYPLFGDKAAAGSVARYVFDLADWDRSGWIVPHGVSGVRGSGHDLDQRQAWLAGELVPMAYGPEAVAEATVATEAR